MKNKPSIKTIGINIWILLTILIPSIMGIVLLLNPTMIQQNPDVYELSKFIGVRNIVFSAMILIAFAIKDTRMLAILFLGRTLSEFGDCAVTILAKGQINSMVVVPFIFGSLSLLVAFVLYNDYKKGLKN